MNDIIFKGCMSVCHLLGKSLSEDECQYIESVPTVDFLTAFSFHHRLSSVLCGVLTDKTKYKEMFERATEETFRQLKNDVMEEAICKRLSENGVPHIILKGNRFRRFYPDFLVRTSNDIDILVPKKNIDTSLEILESMGFNPSCQNENEIELNKLPSYHVELHSSLGGLTKKQRSYLEKIAQSSFSVSEKSGSLSDNDFYIYTVYHLYKHFVHAGAGVRMLFDVYIVGQYESLDREYIEKALGDMGILEFEKTITALNEALFGNSEMTDEQKELAVFVFESGAYGTQENENSLKYVTNEISGSSCASLVISNYQLDFSSMKARYRILERFGFLYPFCCVHRFVKGLIFKRKIFKPALKGDIKILKDERSRLKHIFKIAKII